MALTMIISGISLLNNDVPIFHLLSQTVNWHLRPGSFYIVFFAKAPAERCTISGGSFKKINQPPIPYIPPAEQPIDKKKAFKIVKIVAACVIGAVIIAGIAINVTAAISGNSKSIFGNSSISDWVNRPEMYSGDY